VRHLLPGEMRVLQSAPPCWGAHRAATVAEAQAAGFTVAGVQLEVVSSFRYLGITFAGAADSSQNFAPARTQPRSRPW
jgi:hypothetical protein